MSGFLTPALLTSLAASGAYAFTASTHLYTPLQGQNPITSATSVSSAVASSTTVTKLINPRGFQSWSDSRSVTLRLPPSTTGLSDEQLLARFTKGFFGGWVFGPERTVLKLPVWRSSFVDFPRRGVEPRKLWKKSEVSSKQLPGVDTLFFGAFQVVDKNINDQSAAGRAETSKGTESYIDFAYGSNESSFAGVHRFSVVREGSEDNVAGGDGEKVRLTMSCVTCNPLKDKKLAPDWAFTFHRTYAMLLFREGVAEIVK